MAVESVSFDAQVDDFVRSSQARMTAVFRESAQRIVADMQTPVAKGGNMPVDTGFLRASLRMSKDQPLGLSSTKPTAAAYTYDAGSVTLAIAGAMPGETLYASYTAAYALVVHYGRKGKPGRQWVTLAAMKWPQVVAQVCAEVRARTGG